MKLAKHSNAQLGRFFVSEPSGTENAELNEMIMRIGAILAILALGALIGGDYILSSQVKGALEVEVRERSTTVLRARSDIPG